jgi:hypothetical protein
MPDFKAPDIKSRIAPHQTIWCQFKHHCHKNPCRPVESVEVTSVQGKTTLHIHQFIIDQIPYLCAQQARWTDGTLKLQLPDGIGLKSFAGWPISYGQ